MKLKYLVLFAVAVCIVYVVPIFRFVMFAAHNDATRSANFIANDGGKNTAAHSYRSLPSSNHVSTKGRTNRTELPEFDLNRGSINQGRSITNMDWLNYSIVHPNVLA
jgi:hypothetical protein